MHLPPGSAAQGPVQTVEVPVPMTQEEVVHVPKVITQNRVRRGRMVLNGDGYVWLVERMQFVTNWAWHKRKSVKGELFLYIYSFFPFG